MQVKVPDVHVSVCSIHVHVQHTNHVHLRCPSISPFPPSPKYMYIKFILYPTKCFLNECLSCIGSTVLSFSGKTRYTENKYPYDCFVVSNI